MEKYADLRKKRNQKSGKGGGGDSGGTSQLSKLKSTLENQRSQMIYLHARENGGGY